MKSVYSAVRTGALNKAVCASSLEGSLRYLSSFYGKEFVFREIYNVMLMEARMWQRHFLIKTLDFYSSKEIT